MRREAMRGVGMRPVGMRVAARRAVLGPGDPGGGGPAMSNALIWGMIDAEPILFPLDIEEFNSAMLLFTVPAATARSLLPGQAFELVEREPGWAQLVLAASDFRRNPWGDYDEISLGFFVRPVGAPEEVSGVLVHRTLVNQQFGYEAGRRALSFPRDVDEIDVGYRDDAVTFALTVGDDPTLALGVPRLAPEGEPERVETLAYSYLDDVAHCTTVEVDVPTDVVDPNDVAIDLGVGPLAADLRRLGLPKVPDYCSWGEGLAARFHAPRPV